MRRLIVPLCGVALVGIAVTTFIMDRRLENEMAIRAAPFVSIEDGCKREFAPDNRAVYECVLKLGDRLLRDIEMHKLNKVYRESTAAR